MKEKRIRRRKDPADTLQPTLHPEKVQLTPPDAEITGAQSLEMDAGDVPRLLKLADSALKPDKPSDPEKAA